MVSFFFLPLQTVTLIVISSMKYVLFFCRFVLHCFVKFFFSPFKYSKNFGLIRVNICIAQLYMESIQDLLAPEKTNIPIVEDGRTGEVSVPGATLIKIQNLDHFLQLLEIGEANRHAANTKLNTESSRSHAILMVCIVIIQFFVNFLVGDMFERLQRTCIFPLSLRSW